MHISKDDKQNVMSSPVLSLILPMYNVENYIVECLESIYCQAEAEKIEVILINDGSPDRSAEVAEEWLSTHAHNKKWTILNQENKKQGAARNYGVAMASGQYIWYVDTDDWISADSLRRLIQIIENEHPEAIAFNALRKLSDGSVVPHYTLSFTSIRTSGVEHLKQNINYCSSPCNIVIARDFIVQNNLNFLEYIFHEDTEYMARVYYKLKTLIVLSESLYIVRTNPMSTTRRINHRRAFDLLTIAQSLHEFYIANKQDLQANILHKVIAMCVNTAMSQAVALPQESKTLFGNELNRLTHLFSHFCKSDSLKYKIEGLLFSVFAFNRFWCYNSILHRLYK